MLTCSLLEKFNDWIGGRGQFQRLFIWVCEIKQSSYKLFGDAEHNRVDGGQGRVLTFGGDHELTGQSQRSHGVLVHQGRETACTHKDIPLLNCITLTAGETMKRDKDVSHSPK